MVDRRAQDRDNRRVDRHLRRPQPRVAACIVTPRLPERRSRPSFIDAEPPDAEFMRGHCNVLVVGPNGVRKTFSRMYLAQAARPTRTPRPICVCRTQ